MGPRTIFLVDDELLLVKELKHIILELEGYWVT